MCKVPKIDQHSGASTTRICWHTDLPQLLPLSRFVVIITGEAAQDDQSGVKKAVRRYHNRLANGSIPRSIFRKIGKELFVHIEDFNDWVNSSAEE